MSAVSYYIKKEGFPLSKRLDAPQTRQIVLEELPGLQGRNVNWRSGINTIDHETGLAPLMIAAIQGKRDITAALLDRGAEVDLKDEKKGRTALHFAAKTGHADCMKELLKRAAAPNAVDNYKKTALMHAAKGGYLDCVLLLLQRGASYNMVDGNGFSAMHYAARFGHHMVVSALIKATAAIEFRDELDGLTALHYAAQYGRKETVRVLIEEGFAKVNRRTTTQKQTPLMLAAKEGNKSIVSMLIAKGAETNLIDINGWTALHYAASWNRRDSAHILIADGLANLNARDLNKDGTGGAPPLIVAAKGGHIELIKLLLNYGADINLPEIFTGENALAAAAGLGLRDSVLTLISYHADINYQNHLTYTTPLMTACMHGKRGTIIALLDAYADINILDRRSLSAFAYANMNNHRDVLLSAILHCSPFAKVNLLPWLELECPKFIRGSSYGGPSSYLNQLLYTNNGLYYGLYRLTGDFDVYLVYALAMIASLCQQAIEYQRAYLMNDKETSELMKQQHECIRMLQITLQAREFVDDCVFTDAFLLGSYPCKQVFHLGKSSTAESMFGMGRYEDKYFMSSLWYGPLALCIDNELSAVLDCNQIRDRINACFLCCQRDYGVEVDGYGLRSQFLRWRYYPAFMFLMEGLGNLLFLGAVMYYVIYLAEDWLIAHVHTSYTPRYDNTGYEAMLGLFTVTLLTYQLGLLEEKRWYVSPSIVFHYKDLEKKRYSLMKRHFFDDPYRFMDLMTLFASLSWLVLRVCLSWSAPADRSPYMLTASTQLLALSMIPTAGGLLRYPAAFYPELGRELLTMFLFVQQLGPYFLAFIAVGVGFGIPYRAIFAKELPTYFDSIGQTSQTMFHAVLRNYDETMFVGSPNASIGITISFFFLLTCVVLLFNGIIGKIASNYERNSLKAKEWWILSKCITLRTHSVVLEKSALCMLPPPFCLLGVGVYIAHAYYGFRGKISLNERTCASFGGNVTDYFLAVLLLIPSATYEYFLQHVIEVDHGFAIKLFNSAISPVGIGYGCICLLWKCYKDNIMRMILKSRIGDGRFRLSFSAKRDGWELHMLTRFEDDRLFKELEKFALDKEMFDDVDDLHRKRRKMTLTDQYGGGGKGNKKVAIQDGEGESKDDERVPDEYESDDDEDMEITAQGHKKLHLWQKMLKAMIPYYRRDLDYMGKNVRVAPVQPFLQLANVPPLGQDASEGDRVLGGPLPGGIHAVKGAIPAMDPRQLQGYSTAQILDPRYKKTADKVNGAVVLLAKDIHSNERGSIVPGMALDEYDEEEREKERLRKLAEAPQLVFVGGVPPGKPGSRLNPYQPGMLYNEQWNELAQENEPVDSHLVSTYNPFEPSELSQLSLGEGDKEGGIEGEREGSVKGVKRVILPPQASPIRPPRPVAGERDEDKRVRQILEKEDLQLVNGNDESVNEAQNKLEWKSFYFKQQKYPPIFTAVERKKIFEIVLPEIFVDDFAHAVDSNSKTLYDMEIRMKHGETLQVRQMQMVKTLMDRVDMMGMLLQQQQQMQQQMMMMQQQQSSYVPRFGADAFPSSSLVEQPLGVNNNSAEL